MHVVDQSLLSRLLDEHGPALVLYAQQLCNWPEDVVQEAFIRLMRQRPAPDNIVPWLYRVVRNEALNSSRASARRARHERAGASHSTCWFVPPSDDAIDSRSATEALEMLPSDEREVIVLRIWGGQSFEEIAELIGKSTSTAHRRYEQGLALLREKWRVTCPDKSNPE
jgi:RNA polymerase sigma-70 factor (ECF subfamily)